MCPCGVFGILMHGRWAVTQDVTLSPCFWKRSLQGEYVGLSVPPESCIPPSPPTPISLWQAEKDLFRHGGREKERDEETLGMWAGSSKRQKEGLLTSDHGLCFNFATINQEWCFGSSLWSFGMSLLLFQRQYQARKLIRRDNLGG